MVTTGKVTSQGERPLGAHRIGGDHKIGLWQAAGGALFVLLVSSAPVSAQGEGAAAEPIPGAPTPAPPDAEEEATREEESEEALEEEQGREVLPFFLSEPSLTDTLMPDARPDLNVSVLFPPNALAGVRRPERGFQVGKFEISPSARVAAAYDNFNGRDGDDSDDITGSLGASVRARSLFERHSLGFGVDAAISNPQRGPGDTTPDRVAVTSSVNGRLDLTQRSSLSAEGRLARGAQSPEAQEAGAEEEPTIFTAAGAIAYEQTFNRLGWQVRGGVNRTEADDGEQAAEQDRTSYRVSPGVNYRVARRLTLFGDSSYSINQYDRSGEGGSRDSQIVRGDVGVSSRLSQTLSTRIGVGYVGVFFDNSERDNQHSPAFTANLRGAINLDRLTLLRIGLSHSTDLTTADDAAIVNRTQFSTSLDRSLTSASAILARLALIRSDFVNENRTDYDVIAQLAYSHSLTRNIALNLGYRFVRRFSDSSINEFYRNTVSIGLSAAF